MNINDVRTLRALKGPNMTPDPDTHTFFQKLPKMFIKQI